MITEIPIDPWLGLNNATGTKNNEVEIGEWWVTGNEAKYWKTEHRNNVT